VDIPVDPYLYEALTSCGVETAVLPRSNFSFYGRAFLALIPSMLIILCIRALQYRTKEIFSEKIYDLLKMNPHHLILVPPTNRTP
jgi:cell division protease FtsH